MKFTIEVNEKELSELITQELCRKILSERTYENREARLGIRDGIDKAIRSYIYDKKDIIIDRVVERASMEIVKKGLPKLFEKIEIK